MDKKEKEDKKEVQDGFVEIKKSELEALKKEVETAKNNAQEYLDKYLRSQADIDNARKRMQREQQEFIKYANEGIILEMLTILDDLQRSIKAREEGHQDSQAFLKGIEMILSHIYEMLKKHDVKPIEAEGKKFDPHFHEALMQIEDNFVEENTVVEELQKGYLLGERIIRTAKVKVSKKTEDKSDHRQ